MKIYSIFIIILLLIPFTSATDKISSFIILDISEETQNNKATQITTHLQTNNGLPIQKELITFFINDKIFTATIDEDNSLSLKQNSKKDSSSILWGTTRSIINSALIGVSTGHEKTLELSGVGFRANLKGNILNLQIGFSHDVEYKIPERIKILVEKTTTIKISGIDKELVGKVASDIKMIKPVEPYKAKGIREKGQYVLRKEGKKK